MSDTRFWGFHMAVQRPSIGLPTFLVYRECPCGEWVCTGEGALSPRCPECGEEYLPGGATTHAEAMFGESREESRRIRSLGFVGFLTNEMSAVRLVRASREQLGLDGLTYAAEVAGVRREPYFLPREVSRV